MKKENTGSGKVSTENYKGVRDFYPREMNDLEYIFSVWDKTLKSFGYEKYGASILEPSELYESKTSEEIVNEQTYTFTDRGDRKVTLRPEMTPTVARMVARKQKELSLPIRWYSTPNVFRYERPQKGRLREHWQLNADLFGINDINAEAEMIEMAYRIMENFGLDESDFVVKINDRKILNHLFKEIGLDDQKTNEMLRLIDKKDKIEDFNEQAEKIIGEPFNMVIAPNSEINELIDKLNERGLTNIVFDPLLTRGFDYYTGIVFEIFDTDPDNNRSLFGGGRYDHLLENFSETQISAVGFGMGDVTITEALEKRNLLPSIEENSDLYICLVSEEFSDQASVIAKELRSAGINVEIDYSFKNVSKQLEKASRKGIPLVVCIGEDEISSQKLKIKNLKTGKEKKVKVSKAAEFVLKEIQG